MRKFKNLLMFAMLAIAVLSIGAHKTKMSHAPSIRHAVDISSEQLEATLPGDDSAETVLAAEPTDIFSLKSNTVSGANIESAEQFSELYIEEYE